MNPALSGRAELEAAPSKYQKAELDRQAGPMHVPILKQRDYLMASVQSALSDEDLIQLRDDLSKRVGQHRSRGDVGDGSVQGGGHR